MPKYIIEGGIDFYAELHNPQQESESIENENENENSVCLLSNMPLGYGHITLPCNHVFNFMPLYNEVLSQKTNPELLKNVYHTKLSKNNIKCPYCRVIHTNVLLPYIVGDKRIPGVNGPSTMCMAAPFKCQYSVMMSKPIGGGRKKQAVLSECSAVKNIYCRRGEDAEQGEFKFLCKKHANPNFGTPKVQKGQKKKNQDNQITE